jgi:hypothetical protein
MGRYQHLDAAESAFLQRELEHIKTGTYEIRYPELRARRFIPLAQGTPNWAETITYWQYDRVGMAKLIKDYADDLPRADIKGAQFFASVESLGNSYGFSIQELRAARGTGVALDARKARAAREFHEEKVDEIAAFGATGTLLKGFLNHPNVPAASVANPGSGTTWAVKRADPLVLLQDITDAANAMITATKGIEKPDTLLLPTTQYGLLSTTPMSVQGTTTAMQFLLATNPWIRGVDYWDKLVGAGAGGTDRMVIYRRSNDVLELEIPQEFEQLEEQQRNLEFVVPCHSRIGGVVVYRPLAIMYRDGI